MPRFGAKRKSRTDSAGIGTIVLEKSVEQKILTEISKSRIITASEIGKKHGLNIGMVRDLLKEQALKGTIIPVFKIQGNQVYSSPSGLKALESDKEKIRLKKEASETTQLTKDKKESEESRTKKPEKKQ